MGHRFKNNGIVKFFGWMSVIALTYLNLSGLPSQMEAFFGGTPSQTELTTAHSIAYVLIVGVLLLLAWTIWDLYKGNKRIMEASQNTP